MTINTTEERANIELVTSEAANPPVVEGPGKLLKSRREEAVISEMDAASRMKISVQQLRALESDDFANLPAPIFVRNFLARYAEMLNLDAQELVRMYEAAGGESNQPTLARVSLRENVNGGPVPVRWVSYALVGVGALLVVLWASTFGENTATEQTVAEQVDVAPAASAEVATDGAAQVTNELALPAPSANNSIDSEGFADLSTTEQQ
ncbi:MAG: helix-turn-helix domain-containing protein [Gammaproteobacteria bacterium]|nr:helix-turn-helix domain-containing protein [Gammaproteobacteria bacterium]